MTIQAKDWKFKRNVSVRKMPDAYFRPEDVLSNKAQIKAVQDAQATLASWDYAVQLAK